MLPCEQKRAEQQMQKSYRRSERSKRTAGLKTPHRSQTQTHGQTVLKYPTVIELNMWSSNKTNNFLTKLLIS